MMQIKPPSATNPLAAPAQPAKPAAASDKPSDFSQLLKTAQAGTPAPTPTHGQG